MSQSWTAATPCRCLAAVLVLLLLVLPPRALSIRADKALNKDDHVSATVNATVLDSKGNPVQMMSNDDGTYGQNSPKSDTKGTVIAPAHYHGVVDRQGCDPHTRFVVPPRTGHWVALLQRGNCTFKEKILKASAYNASAVLVYNNSTEKTVKMGHDGTGDTVAVMITEAYGREILSHLERNLTVLVSVVVGQRGPTKNINRGSLVFVSISFIVLMIISSAWLIFYFIQKIRYTNARDRSQRRLGDAAKKAIGKLTTRTVKKGDKVKCGLLCRMCVDPWLNEHCTCPMCKLNILKALGIMTNLPCVDNVAFGMERIGRSQTSGSQRMALVDLSNEASISMEPLRPSGGPQGVPSDGELTPHTGEINIAVTSGHFFNRSSGSPRSIVCEVELPDNQVPHDLYDDNKS
uniref:Ring finger protein 130 n=1 Tax=Gadus morhua TaxID=8049 RepID=A0A8C5B4C7_GADMO